MYRFKDKETGEDERRVDIQTDLKVADTKTSCQKDIHRGKQPRK